MSNYDHISQHTFSKHYLDTTTFASASVAAAQLQATSHVSWARKLAELSCPNGSGSAQLRAAQAMASAQNR